MSNCHQIEENFETLKDLFTTMSQAIEQLEKQQSKLENDNKRLNDTNDVLLEITKKQRLMVGTSTSDESRGTSAEEITNNYRISINKKLADLEKQLTKNQTAFTDDFNFDEKDAKQMLKLKVQIHSLLEENQSLKSQLSVFQDLYDKIIAEIKQNNLKKANSSNQQQGNDAMCASPSTADSLDKNDVQPLQVNIIDSDVDKVKEK